VQIIHNKGVECKVFILLDLWFRKRPGARLGSRADPSSSLTSLYRVCQAFLGNCGDDKPSG